jgi:selenocysteine lyase/cysteine desulfurase
VSRVAFGAEFVGAEGFLNSPTYGLPPGFMFDALQDCLREWQAGTMDVPSFDESVRAARAGYAVLAGVPVGSVTMAGTVSSALGLVAAAIPDGSRVATLPNEFTSTSFPFAAQEARGVTITELESDELVTAARDYDVVTASLVQSSNGSLLDVDALRANVAGTDTLTVIDITQALGWKNVTLPWADVTVAAVYKWLLAPRGAAWMSLSERVSSSMTPHAANWYAADEPWSTIYGLPLKVADDARRFDVSPTWFSALGSGLTLSWLASLDQAAVEAHAVGLATLLRTELQLPQQPSAIVSIPTTSAEKLRDAGIRASIRAGAVRVGFHLYNTEDDLDHLLDVLR